MTFFITNMKLEEYKIRIINSKLVLINIYSSSDVMVFEGISKIIISKLINCETIDKIIEEISLKYKKNYKDVERDVYSFVEELKYLGIYNE